MAATVKMTSFKRNSCFSTLNLAHQVLVALILICDVLTDFQIDLKIHGKKIEIPNLPTPPQHITNIRTTKVR